MTHIQVKHVKKEWGDESLFEDITFSVAYGEHIGIVGANGSGKSTLVSMIEGNLSLIPVNYG